MRFIRKYKISKLLNKPIEKSDEKLMSFISNILKNLTIYNIYDDTYYMNPSGKWVIKKYRITNTILLSYSNFTRFIEFKYSISSEDICDIVKYLIPNIVSSDTEIKICDLSNAKSIEKDFKNKIQYEL